MKTDVTHISQNQSARQGATIKLIVLHTTEGADGKNDLANLGEWFDNPAADVSAHIGNNVRGMDARYVEDTQKAWTACNLNPVALNIEQIGYASFSKDEWMRKRHLQLKNTAMWIAHWSKKYSIPIERGKTSGIEVKRPGVVQHKDLGSAGCGHEDCGPGYPMRYVILLARLIRAEHFDNRHKDADKLRRKVNRIRKRYGLDPFKAPN